MSDEPSSISLQTPGDERGALPALLREPIALPETLYALSLIHISLEGFGGHGDIVPAKIWIVKAVCFWRAWGARQDLAEVGGADMQGAGCGGARAELVAASRARS